MKNFANHIGVSTNLFENPYNIAQLIKRFSDNFSVVEIEFEKELKKILEENANTQNNFVNELNFLKKEKNLFFSVHAPYLGKNTDLSSTDEEIRYSAIELMIKTLNISHKIGAKRFTFHPGFIDKSTNISTNELLDNLKKSLAVMSKEAKKLGITLCLENTGDERPRYIVLNDKEHKDLCEEFEIKLTLDLIHYTSFMKMNSYYYERLSQLLPYVDNIHLADMSIPKHLHFPLGKGNFPYEKVVSFVFSQGYKGNIIIEERGGNYTEEEYLREAIKYKKSIWNQHEKLSN